MMAPGGSAAARGAPVVRAVLEAALDELSRVGYGALTVEQVAARAGVNKTTVYRRWPTKPELIAAALSALAASAPALEETGEVRADLLAVTRRIAATMGSQRGRATLRMLLGGCADPDLVALASSAREQFVAPARRVVAAAVRRGALRSTVDPDLLLETISGWIVNALFRERVSVDEDHLARLVDLLLDGARERRRFARARSSMRSRPPGAPPR